jgi:acetyl-CoA carboxylase carboxyl transferase subunit alpha
MAREEGEIFFLDFEKPIEELEKRIKNLEKFSKKANIEVNSELQKYREQQQNLIKEIYSKLTPWQRVQVARHPDRPGVEDYINLLFSDFIELHGDKSFRDDKALVCGLAKIENHKIMFIGQKKGKDTREKKETYFGCMHPEGYRKALEKMWLAQKFNLPVVTFVNTPGAYPGIGAEERGQANLIAKNLFEMSRIKTPTISVIIGEGGSGGALGICLADIISMLENSFLSVISPEGCAAILWRDSSKASLAAELLRLSAKELLQLEIVDEIIPEPVGGAHRDPIATASNIKDFLIKTLEELKKIDINTLLDKRYKKYRKMGVFIEKQSIVGKPIQQIQT